MINNKNIAHQKEMYDKHGILSQTGGKDLVKIDLKI